MNIDLASPTLEAATHNECLGFILAPIAIADRTTAHHVAGILKEVCQGGYADRAAVWRNLTPSEQNQYRELLSPPPILQDFARRILEALAGSPLVWLRGLIGTCRARSTVATLTRRS